MTAERFSDITIERFAEVAAAVDDGYSPRPSTLDAAGLDAMTWRQVEHQWMTRLADGDDAALALRFATVYSRTRNRLSGSTAPASTPIVLGSGGEVCYCVPPNVDETLPTGVAPLDVTNDTLRDEVVVGGPVPHRAATNLDTVPSYQAEEVGDGAAARGASPAAVDVTIGCAPDAAVRAVLPFVPSPDSMPPPPPGKRWHYFDTKTGLPLAVPVLADIPLAPMG